MSPRNGNGALSNGTNAVIGSRSGAIGTRAADAAEVAGAAIALKAEPRKINGPQMNANERKWKAE